MIPMWMRLTYKAAFGGYINKVSFVPTTEGGWWLAINYFGKADAISLQEFLDRVHNEEDT